MNMSKRAAVAISGIIFTGAAALAVDAAIPAGAKVKIGAPVDNEKSQSRDDAQPDTNRRVNGILKGDDDNPGEDANENAGENAGKDAGKDADKDANENADKDSNGNGTVNDLVEPGLR